MSRHDVLRIAREIADIQKGTDLSIAVAASESDLRQVKALIVGPPGTPYEYGFFEFAIKFGPDYPSLPPKVEAKTTNHGRCRFNPNIYAGGKVCLSILGTWEGEKGEEWSSAQGLESILLSIQSLMSSNPYENEPGFEDSKGNVDKCIREHYCAKIRHETLRVAVIQKLEAILNLSSNTSEASQATPEQAPSNSSDDDSEKADSTSKDTEALNVEPFRDFEKRRFLWYYGTYLDAIEEGASKYTDGKAFKEMPFETDGNSMSGRYLYGELRTRLVRIKDALREETERWADEGATAAKQDLNIAFNLQSQFNQFSTYQKQKNMHNIDVSLLDGNPFVWMVTYFGRSGTNLDGGMFKIRISLSPKFPDEQPRVRVETKMYHHRVAKDGTLCYFPSRVDEVKHHIQAIVVAIEEVSPPYDPRAILHPEATKLFWGSDNDKKLYCRTQRKSAQDSVDEMAS